MFTTQPCTAMDLFKDICPIKMEIIEIIVFINVNDTFGSLQYIVLITH